MANGFKMFPQKFIWKRKVEKQKVVGLVWIPSVLLVVWEVFIFLVHAALLQLGHQRLAFPYRCDRPQRNKNSGIGHVLIKEYP